MEPDKLLFSHCSKRSLTESAEGARTGWCSSARRTRETRVYLTAGPNPIRMRKNGTSNASGSPAFRHPRPEPLAREPFCAEKKTMSEKPLAGKTGIVFGVANKRSIAWAIAQAWHQAGANLIFNYQGDRLKENVEDLAATFGPDTPIFPCDVADDTQIDTFFANVKKHTGKLDLMLHAVAFAPREALEGRFLDTSREAFRIAHDISAFSLVALTQRAAPMMPDGGSIVAMTYYGSEKVVPHYNVMGVAKAALEASTRYLADDLGPQKIRVNCISAGPVKTLAAMGISGFKKMITHYEEHAPLRRTCALEELGATGTFLASDGAAAITGQVLYVDGGYQIMGM